MGIIRHSQIISLDSNIFIRALDDPTSLGEKSRNLIEEIKEITPRIFISTMVLEEFFVRVYKEKRDKDIQRYLDFINLDGLCIIIDINKEIALRAAKLRAQYPSLRAPDAIHIASAIAVKANIFITTDRRLPKKIEKLEIKTL